MDYGDTQWYEISRVARIKMTNGLFSGFPHRSSQDDVYKGYFIPKGLVAFCIILLSITLTLIIGT